MDFITHNPYCHAIQPSVCDMNSRYAWSFAICSQKYLKDKYTSGLSQNSFTIFQFSLCIAEVSLIVRNQTFVMLTSLTLDTSSTRLKTIIQSWVPLYSLCTMRSHGKKLIMLGSKQRKVALDWYEFFCFGSPTV